MRAQTKLTILTVALLAIWLIGWIVLSWGAIQDDALIHLRYANYLHNVHFITFDGIHRSYGTSSLLYVFLLAQLRSLTDSPLLPREVSSFAHLCLFAIAAAACVRASRNASTRTLLLAFSLLLLLVAPSAVRWLDDGMETGIAMILAGTAAWQTHAQSTRVNRSGVDFATGILIGATLVLLRPELGIIALMASAILGLEAVRRGGSPRAAGWLRSILAASHFLLGAIVAALAVRLTMKSFLPDTARAKSHGITVFLPSLGAAVKVIVGALVFGLGMVGLWLVSAVIVLSHRNARRGPAILANTLFPIVLFAAALRGQEIQGFRYLVWALFFPIVWNLMELWRMDSAGRGAPAAGEARWQVVSVAFLSCILLAFPIDGRLMYRVLTTRARTMRQFMGEDLAPSLHERLGVAVDVGYISYFSQASICDLAGLVNGPALASLTLPQRAALCAAQHPSFAFFNAGQAAQYMEFMDMADWRVCGQYDFGNMRQPDRHFLIVDPQIAPAVCRATGEVSGPLRAALSDSAYP